MVDPVVEAELRHVARQVAQFEAGALCPKLFLKLRLQYGIYSLRDAPGAFMARVRLPLGVVTPDELEALADLLERFAPARPGHLTTRQDLQLYGIAQQALPDFLAALAEAGLTSREASGGVVRNITCCPWAGISPEEPFDVTPYAWAASDYLLRNPLTQLLPRKVKIAFEGCATDHARTAIHDLGVTAALHEGRRGFRIDVGGGLGATPRAARRLEPWTPDEWLLPTLEAVLRIFERHGDRQHRARARLKFLVERMGWEVFRGQVLEERSLVWATQSGRMLLARPAAPRAPERAPDEAVTRLAADPRWQATNVRPQRQPGLVSVLVRVPCGDVTAESLRGLARLARAHAGGLRTTPTQDLLLRHVPASRLGMVYQALAGQGWARPSADRLADVTRCPGADSCLSAITRPRGLAEALEARFQDGLAAWADAPLSIKISGCPNSCGQHHIADIGAFGVALPAGARTLPAYQLLLGGGTREGEARFGQRLARIPARRVPDAIGRLLAFYGERRVPDEPFAAFVERVGVAACAAVVEALAALPAEGPLDPSLLIDLGATTPFTLQAGRGECAE